MFRVPGFIDGHFHTEMSNKCLVLIISVAFVGVTLYTLILGPVRYGCREESTRDPTPENDRLPSMDLSKAFTGVPNEAARQNTRSSGRI